MCFHSGDLTMPEKICKEYRESEFFINRVRALTVSGSAICGGKVKVKFLHGFVRGL
jgi:hypothetical protein